MRYTYKADKATAPSSVDRPASAELPEAALVEDIQRRVASAMNIAPGLVKIDGHQIGFAGWIRRCWGTADRVRFFAKIFIVDPYPIPLRFPSPAEELATPHEPQRPVEEQVAAEWNSVQEMRSFVGAQSTPGPLGYSIRDRILVFEEVDGLRMDFFVNRGWPGGRKGRSAETAMFQAGAWLRALHGSTLHGEETIEFSEVVDALRGLLVKEGIESTPYAGLALKVLESARRQLKPATHLRVPLALNHGDFSLPNLLWNHDRQHLWVVDFEVSAPGPIFHDLGMMIFDLRSLLLHPLTSETPVWRWEECFWRGYGPIPEDLLVFTNALATARIFYASLPRISTLGERRGWMGGLKALIYKGVLQHFMIARILRAQRSS